MHPRYCRPPPHPGYRPATSWVHYTTSCNTQSSASEDGQNNCPKHVELSGIINKPLLLHLVGCLYYLYQWCTVKQITSNEMYLLIKYIKSVLWREAKHLSYVEDARCLKVNVQHLKTDIKSWQPPRRHNRCIIKHCKLLTLSVLYISYILFISTNILISLYLWTDVIGLARTPLLQ
jgi:hypothetical protein